MESGEEDICEEYESSLEDLTFNSKPLINVLTMLAEENSQHASSITKLIASRIHQVQQQYKMPSLYLLDSIVKNVGGDYLHLVAQIMEETFTCVFEKADEKARRDLYKLRHTWSPYFPAKLLHDLDVSVNKHDPGWPIAALPPPSPSIHINPKFLKKAESTGGVASLTAEISTPQEHHVVEGHHQRLIELERLQQEQLKLTELEIQEHQMKRDLLLKKQQQERQLLLQQQKQDILHLRLTPDGQESHLSNGPPSSTVAVPVSTKAVSTESNQGTFNSRDPRLRRNEQKPDHSREPKPAVVGDIPLKKPVRPVKPERMLIEDQASLPLPVNSSHQFEQTSHRPPEHFTQLSQPTSEMSQIQDTRNIQHMAFAEDPEENISRIQPRAHLERERTGSPRYGHLEREVTGSPKYGDLQVETKAKHNHRRRNSGDWPSHAVSHENICDEPPVSKTQGGRGKVRKRRRRSVERQREKGKSGRGRGRERNRDTGDERFPNSEFQTDSRFVRREELRDSRYLDDPLPFREDWNSDVEQRGDNFVPRNNHPRHHNKWRKDQIVYVRGKDHDEIVRSVSPVIPEQRLMGMGPERDRIENIEPQFRETEMRQDHFHPSERKHPVFHDDPRDQPIGEPLSKKLRPLLSDKEIIELRNRKEGSPNTGRMTPPPRLQEGYHNPPFDRGDQPFPHHVDGPFHPNFGPPSHEEWVPGFEIPRELMLDRQNEIMIQAERRLQAGDLTVDQHHELVDKLHQLYELQRHPEQKTFPPEMPLLHPDHQPRSIVPPRPGAPMDIEGPPDAGPGRPMLARFEEHPRIPLRGPAPHGPVIRHDGPRFEANEPHMRQHNEDFRGPPMEHDMHSLARPMPMGPGVPPFRSDRMLEAPPRLDDGSNPPYGYSRPMEEMPTPRTPPRQDKVGVGPPHTPNTMMEKKSVDDLFRRLMQVGIIKVTPESGSESPQHAPSPDPPQAEVQQPHLPPVKPVSVPSVLPLLNAVMSKKEVSVEKKHIPVIKLVPDELKRRHEGVITSLYEGTQCSSCGLRFPGEAAKIYREHLDWHFRKNRREKDSRRVAHRLWYFIVNDWLNYEEISDPEERARSSFFDVAVGAVDSPDPLKEVKENTGGEGSCPVLSDDSQAEAECDICCEKFEQFWEETNEEWHYKSAVRIDGKTYHLLCYQDAKENQSHTEDDNEQNRDEEESMDVDTDQTSPVKNEAKTQDKQARVHDGESKITETKEASEINTLGEKTVKSDAKSSEKDSCKVESVGPDIKGSISVSNNAVDNKENETKGDDK